MTIRPPHRLDHLPFQPQLYTSAIDLLRADPSSATPAGAAALEGIASLTGHQVCLLLWGLGRAYSVYGVLVDGQLVQQAYSRAVEMLPHASFAVCRVVVVNALLCGQRPCCVVNLPCSFVKYSPLLQDAAYMLDGLQLLRYKPNQQPGQQPESGTPPDAHTLTTLLQLHILPHVHKATIDDTSRYAAAVGELGIPGAQQQIMALHEHMCELIELDNSQFTQRPLWRRHDEDLVV